MTRGDASGVGAAYMVYVRPVDSTCRIEHRQRESYTPKSSCRSNIKSFERENPLGTATLADR